MMYKKNLRYSEKYQCRRARANCKDRGTDVITVSVIVVRVKSISVVVSMFNKMYIAGNKNATSTIINVMKIT